MTNPAGFANVRAHAEAHLRAMAAASAPSLNAASLISAPRSAQVSPPPAPAALRTLGTTARTPREFSSRSDEPGGPGDHWVTIDGNHVLIHESQGKQPTQERPPLSSVLVLGKKVVITFDAGIDLRDQRTASTVIAGAADLLNKNADKLTDEEKKAIGEVSSFRVTESPSTYLGATGKGSMTLSFNYIYDNSAPWLASTFGHEGQHYLNAGKYSGADLWRDEQSASRMQLGIGSKIGLNANDQKSIRDWMDDKNRGKMQQHMEKGYTD